MRNALVVFWLILSTASALELTAPPAVVLSPSNAVVYWRTDVASGTHAQIIPTTAKISVTDKSPAAEHTVIVSGLQPGVSYSIAIGSARLWLATNTFTTTGALKTPAVAAVPEKKTAAAKAVTRKTEPLKAPPTRKIWGSPESLPDHFARHGGDFHAKDADDYARMSWEFLQRAKTDGLPAKVDEEGVLRVFDPKNGTFASYNHNGTTKTFFKPGSRDYFDRQPGQTVNLKTLK